MGPDERISLTLNMIIFALIKSNLCFGCSKEPSYCLLRHNNSNYYILVELLRNEIFFLKIPHSYLETIIFSSRPWPAVYINFVQILHQIQVLTEPLCRAQARLVLSL